MKLYPTLVKLHDRFCVIKKSRVSTNITQTVISQTARRNELKIVVKVDQAQERAPTKEKKNRIKYWCITKQPHILYFKNARSRQSNRTVTLIVKTAQLKDSTRVKSPDRQFRQIKITLHTVQLDSSAIFKTISGQFSKILYITQQTIHLESMVNQSKISPYTVQLESVNYSVTFKISRRLIS